MRTAGKTTTCEPRCLAAQITHTETRILDRQHLIGRHAAFCKQQVRKVITSPRALLLAGGAGVLIGVLTRPHRSVVHERTAGRRARRLFDSVLSSATLIRTLFPTLRVSDILPFQQPGRASYV
jgi:hypothetical protein